MKPCARPPIGRTKQSQDLGVAHSKLEDIAVIFAYISIANPSCSHSYGPPQPGYGPPPGQEGYYGQECYALALKSRIQRGWNPNRAAIAPIWPPSAPVPAAPVPATTPVPAAASCKVRRWMWKRLLGNLVSSNAGTNSKKRLMLTCNRRTV